MIWRCNADNPAAAVCSLQCAVMLQCCREVWESEVGLTTSFLFNYLNKSWQWSRLGWAGLGWSHQSSPSWANNGYIPASMGCTNQPSTAPARQSSHCPTLALFCNWSSFIIFNLWHYHIRFGDLCSIGAFEIYSNAQSIGSWELCLA